MWYKGKYLTNLCHTSFIKQICSIKKWDWFDQIDLASWNSILISYYSFSVISSWPIPCSKDLLAIAVSFCEQWHNISTVLALSLGISLVIWDLLKINLNHLFSDIHISEAFNLTPSSLLGMDWEALLCLLMKLDIYWVLLSFLHHYLNISLIICLINEISVKVLPELFMVVCGDETMEQSRRWMVLWLRHFRDIKRSRFQFYRLPLSN